jgi:hypothetical protein
MFYLGFLGMFLEFSSTRKERPSSFHRANFSFYFLSPPSLSLPSHHEHQRQRQRQPLCHWPGTVTTRSTVPCPVMCPTLMPADLSLVPLSWTSSSLVPCPRPLPSALLTLPCVCRIVCAVLPSFHRFFARLCHFSLVSPIALPRSRMGPSTTLPTSASRLPACATPLTVK